MEKSESIINLIPAVIKVMEEVEGIDKTMTIGTGNNSYRGMEDKVVKEKIGKAMQRNGLIMIPQSVEESTQLSEWDAIYAGQVQRKQQVFTKVKTTYILAHTSGEWMTVCGYGHGVDSQDKGAGKATTYALKNALLYSFLVPTGKIDDTDATHSDNIEVPAKSKNVEKTAVKIEMRPEVKAIFDLTKVELTKVTSLEKLTHLWDQHTGTFPELKNNADYKNMFTEVRKNINSQTK